MLLLSKKLGRGLSVISLLLGAMWLSSCSKDNGVVGRLAYEVNPLVGTDFVGNTYPGVSAPFGMVQLSPDNGLSGWDRIGGYYYPDSTIAGFSHTHLSGTGAGDMYDISFMPTTEPELKAEGELGLHARFTHDEEEANAGYYSVVLKPYNIKIELTATPRVGIQSYTFLEDSDKACITLNLDKSMNWDKTQNSLIKVSEEGKILEGYRFSTGWARNQKVFFASQLSRKADSVSIIKNGYHENGTPCRCGKDTAGYGYIARLYYKVRKGDKILIETALSSVSIEGAKQNLKAEATYKTFEDYRKANEDVWSKRLSKIEIKGANKEQRTTFYTALYHSQICPTLYSDVDGKYLGADREVYQLSKGEEKYSTFSLWDTYRASHPLYNIIAPKENADMVRSMIEFGEQNDGHLPVWNMWASETDMMIGYHSVPVIVESILKGVYQVQDKSKLMNLFRSTAERKGYRALDEYQEFGYVPEDKEEESVSKTLEYAYDDYAIYLYLKDIKADSSLVSTYKKRAESYLNLWDKEQGFFAPRLANGQFKEGFNPFAYTKAFTESNAYQYLFSVQHQPKDLVNLMGGEEAFGKRLDEFFSAVTPDSIELPIFSTGMIGQYAHGNEPSHHNIFLYNYAKQPWKTAELSRKVCRELYSDKPDGLCGNEDCGQMSAWYVFSAMGFYPLDPLSGQYELTAPLWKATTIHLDNGKTFTVEAPNLSDTHCYIERVELNGKPYKKHYITYEDIMQGAKLKLIMTDKKGICWY